MRIAAFLEAPWREPAEVLSALGERPWTLGLLTGELRINDDARHSPQVVLLQGRGVK